MTNLDCEKMLYPDEVLIWSGSPITGISKGRIVYQFVLAFFVLLLTGLYLLTPKEYIIGKGGLMLDALHRITLIILDCSAIFLIVEPYIEKRMRMSTTFILTNKRIITVIKDKKRETKITKKLVLHYWNTENKTVAIGLNTKSLLLKWSYSPLTDYLFWSMNMYPHYLYGIEFQVYKKIQNLIESA